MLLLVPLINTVLKNKTHLSTYVFIKVWDANKTLLKMLR